MEALTLRSVLSELSRLAGGTITAVDAIESPPGLALRFAPSRARLRLHLQLTPPLLWLDPPSPAHAGGERGRKPTPLENVPVGLGGLFRQLVDRCVGARLVSVEPQGLGRVAFLRLERRDRLGDPHSATLVVEIMGSFGNLILIDGTPETGRIAARLQADRRRGTPRALDSGAPWRAPARTKTDLLIDGAAAVAAAFAAAPRPGDDAAWAARVAETTEGVGPRLARELVIEAAAELPAGAATGNGPFELALVRALERRAELATQGLETGVLTPVGGRPLAVVGLPHAPGAFEATPTASDAVRRIAEAGGATLRPAAGEDPARAALGRAIEARRAEARHRVEQFAREFARRPDGAGDRLRGEALLSYAHEVPRGAETVTLPTGPDAHPEVIALDPRRSAADNAARYFHEARKAERAAEQLPGRLSAAEAHLERCNRFAERFAALPPGDRTALEELEAEWTGVPARNRGNAPTTPTRARGREPAAPGAPRGAAAPSAALQPRRYDMPGGWTILVGRSQEGNDYLTHAVAAPHDLWFHAHGAAGSHVVLKGPDRTARPDKSLILAAAALAALNSKARHASKVPVIYAEKRHVRKPRGGKPGLAAVTHEKSIMVRPAEPAE